MVHLGETRLLSKIIGTSQILANLGSLGENFPNFRVSEEKMGLSVTKKKKAPKS